VNAVHSSNLGFMTTSTAVREALEAVAANPHYNAATIARNGTTQCDLCGELWPCADARATLITLIKSTNHCD
jgi:hypothetical protein